MGGAQLIRSVANKTNDEAGDGTTTSTVLTRAIFSEGCKSVAAGMNPMDLSRGMKSALNVLVDELEAVANPIVGASEEQVAQVATISANSDAAIGNLIAEAMREVGPQGVITVQDGQTLENELETIVGMKFDRGFISPYFVTDQKKQLCKFDEPAILLVEKKISSMQSILPLLEEVVKANKSLIVIAEDVEADALATLVVNRLRSGLKIACVKAPGFGDNRKANLQDIAVLTGGTVVSEELGQKLENVTLDQLGSCKTIEITKDNTTILEGAGSEASINERVEIIQQSIEGTSSDYEKEKLQERLAKLSGGVAVIKVGGGSEVEVNEAKDRVTDALNATRAAVEEGIVPGGGAALLHASKKLPALKESLTVADQRLGVDIIARACEAPMRQIADNAGHEGAVVVGAVLQEDNPNFGFDAGKGEYKDMVAAGIIDPTKVVKAALVDAVSVAALMTTTEAAVVDLPEPEPAAPPMGGAGMPGMGGMGGGGMF